MVQAVYTKGKNCDIKMNSAKIVEKGYDKIAQKYQDQRGKFHRTNELKLFANNFKKGARILDLGCGAGIPIMKFLVDQGFNVTGIDFSKEMLSLAKKNVPETKLIKMNITEIDFPDNTFDGLTAFYSIIHVPGEKQSDLFKKIHKLLKPGGIMLVSMGSEEWEGTNKNFYGAKMIWSQWSPKKSLQIINDAGFEILFDKNIEIGGETHYWIIAKCKK